MIYVEMLGRMGNQMFSYAHARYIQNKFPEQSIGIDFTNFKKEDNTWINYLQYFKCGDNIQTAQRKMSFFQKIGLKVFYSVRRNWHGYAEIYVNEKKWAKLLSVLNIYIFTNGYYPFKYTDAFQNKLLIGFFESSKYFDEIKPILKEEFKAKGFEKNEYLKNIIQNITVDQSICVGVRKGDFASTTNSSYCDICTPSYYENAVKLLKQKIDNSDNKLCKIYVFTDDVQWAKDNLRFEDEVVYITSSVNGQIKPWEMVQLMTYFRYYVIPNSSFFWWGQYLSQYDETMVVAPSMWRSENQTVYKDIYQDEWILLDPIGIEKKEY